MKMRNLIALCAAAAMISGMTANVYADTLETREGLKYRISDTGEDMGLYSGWTSRDRKRYYYKDGEMKRNCWLTSGGEKKNYLTDSGEAATGITVISGTEYEFDRTVKLVPDKWGVTFSIEDVTPTGCTAIFSRSGGSFKGYLNAGGNCFLERCENEEWSTVEALPLDCGMTFSVETKLITEEEPARFDHNWQWFYGELDPGEYRIAMNVTDNSSFTDDDERWYIAYFTIEQ